MPSLKEARAPLRALRRRTGLSLESVGRELAITGMAVGRYESGDVVEPALRIQRGMAKLYGVSLADLRKAMALRALPEADDDEEAEKRRAVSGIATELTGPWFEAWIQMGNELVALRKKT